MRACASEILLETFMQARVPDTLRFLYKIHDAHGGCHAADSVGWESGACKAMLMLLNLPIHFDLHLALHVGWGDVCSLFRGAKFTKNTNYQWSSAARVCASRCTNPWYMTHRMLPFTIRKKSKFAWTAQVYDFGWFWGTVQYDWLAATGISGRSTHGSIIKIQDKKITSKPNTETPQMPLAARHLFIEGSKSRSQ